MEKLSDIIKEEFGIEIKGEKPNFNYIFNEFYVSTETLKRLLPHMEPIDVFNMIDKRKLSYEEILMVKYIPNALNYLITKQKISEDIIEENANKINLYLVAKHQNLSEEFIKKHKDNLNLYDVLQFQNLSEKFIEENMPDEKLDVVASNMALSEDFLKRNWNKNIRYVSIRKQKLSEEFIENLIDNEDISKGEINSIVIYQKLSDKLIDKIITKYDSFKSEGYYLTSGRNAFSLISQYQCLSNDIINKHFNILYLKDIAVYQNVEKIKNKLEKSYVNNDKSLTYFINNNWIYKSAEEKKQEIVKTGKYECYDDYFIAYKGIRPDRYSFFNFQYKYEPGGVYESWCDCSGHENSFGLNVGTSYFVREYMRNDNGLIIRCKIKYEDVGRIVDKGDKIRCFKIEVLD